jgi:hypothetical protein
VKRTSGNAAVICFLHFVCWRSFLLAYPGSLHPVRPITARHLATMLPLPSVPHAGIFASLSGSAVSEFPHSNWRCVIAPRSCLLDAGGCWELSAHAVLVMAATLVPFWLWRSVSQFRHSIVTTLSTQVSRVSIGRRACPLSPELARRAGPLSVGFRHGRVPLRHAGHSALVSQFTHGSESNTSNRQEAHKTNDLDRPSRGVGWKPLLGRTASRSPGRDNLGFDPRDDHIF